MSREGNICSANNFFDLPFSSSNARNRFASDGSVPPTHVSSLLASFLFLDHRPSRQIATQSPAGQ